MLTTAVSLPAQTQTPDDQYLNILSLVDRADTLNEKKQGDLGKAKYTEAARVLQQFRLRYPTWNPKVVSFRLGYVTDKIAVLSQTNPPPSAAISGQADVKPAVDSASVAVKLIEAGAEPRNSLRIQVRPGDKQTVMTTVTSTRDMGIGGPMKVPAIKVALEVTVKEVAGGGDITYESVLGEVTMEENPDDNPLMSQMMKPLLEKVRGLSATSVLSSRGQHRSTSMKPAANADAQTRQMVEELKDSLKAATIPLPEEAVGTGAKWETKRSVKLQGVMTVNQTATYQLVSVEGDQVQIKMTIALSAPNQKVESPMAPGMKLDVTKVVGNSTGEATLNLTQLMPTRASSKTHSEIFASVNMAGQKQSVVMKFDENTVVESK